MSKKIKIGNKMVGPGEPVFIIAEAGVNHNGDFDLAKKLVDAAAAAGADVVKFQTFTAELLVTTTADQAEYQRKNIGKTESQFDMLKRLELKMEFHAPLQRYCEERGILFLSTPFSEPDADFLETINIPAYKIPSGEINNIPYLTHIAKKVKPMIVSTGMSNLDEVKTAVQVIQSAGNQDIIILHSTSNYPPSLGSLNLRAITTLEQSLSQWNIPVGYSDNGSEGIFAEVAAVALGSCVIEKHFTLDKNMEGPDHKASLNPVEFAAMVKAIRATEVMLGTSEKRCTPEEEPIRAVARKSVIAKRDIPAGQILTQDDVIMKRPGNGIAPTELAKVLGKSARQKIDRDTLITWNQLV